MNIALTVTTDRGRSAILDAQLDSLAKALSPKERQALARKLGGYVRTQARRNIRSQQTVDGKSFPPRVKERSRHRAKRRILQGLADAVNADRAMAVVSRAAEGGGVAVTWKNALTAQIAAVQQHGSGARKMTAEAARREKKNKLPYYDDPCTRDQAKSLIREGYRLMVPAKGGGRGPGRNKRPKRVSVQWLERHFTIGHAGLVLRILRTEKITGKKSWTYGVTSRPFLGVTGAQAEEMTAKLAQTLLHAVKR